MSTKIKEQAQFGLHFVWCEFEIFFSIFSEAAISKPARKNQRLLAYSRGKMKCTCTCTTIVLQSFALLKQ